MSMGALSLVMFVCRGYLEDGGAGVDLLYLVDDGYGEDDAGPHHAFELA